MRLRAAAGPAVGAGSPDVVWLKRCGLAREGRVDQPVLAVRGCVVWRRRATAVAVVVGEVVVVVAVDGRRASCRQQWAGSRGAIVCVLCCVLVSSVVDCFEWRLLAVMTASVGVDGVGENCLDDGEVAI